jgi:hypothetical protein
LEVQKAEQIRQEQQNRRDSEVQKAPQQTERKGRNYDRNQLEEGEAETY